MSDSQWIGNFSESGHLLRINPYLDEDPEIQAILDSIHLVLLDAYSTYPGGSENHWGFPQEAEMQGFLVRTDLFGNDGERAAFQAKYGHALPMRY